MANDEHEVNRSTRSGRFVKDSTAQRDPEHTVTEHVGGEHGDQDSEVNRSARTGRFVTETTADLHSSTTETQHL
ncbi:hypothetical protein GCM10010168_18630 [Actinoplanes ianthinogenes]|uniref:Uncharacterized protein n=1 Tax=Actinoplanes ianthinogenes TaxID=122358 RepID=A0ABM7M768_9ACTN|nr:hypothetical protein [Actinoplanes ianthinogenes]BCJ47505.1 hypothetical protein Aiant_81620 [Actinoplanes ianthinogenes]GGR02226.1 hypothetical protein GCM10010168_18630 [Actinoplanes ianthinogenes]